jgi:hypothetical protein
MIKPPITSRTTGIIGTFHLSTESERIAGRQWYSQAHTAALDLSASYPVGVITAAGVIAALSPNNRWYRNLLDADALIDCYHERGAHAASQVKVCTYAAMAQKALTILKLQHPTVEDVATILNGRKITAFYRCILGSQTAVCVDGHAYSIWAGETIRTNKTPKISPRLYEQIARDYIQAAAMIGHCPSPTLHGPNNPFLTPVQLQAITWVAHKRINGR